MLREHPTYQAIVKDEQQTKDELAKVSSEVASVEQLIQEEQRKHNNVKHITDLESKGLSVSVGGKGHTSMLIVPVTRAVSIARSGAAAAFR